MNSTDAQQEERADLAVRKIGGIDETAVTFSPGVTVLEGRNATNRTSLLQSIMAACGSDDVSVKGDAEEATVELTLGEDTYSRTLRRQNGTLISDGDPYLTDPGDVELADLFAFLVETNAARRAVARGDDLRDLVMRPIDTEEIQAEIDRLTAEKRGIEGDLDDIETLKDRLPDLEARRTELDGEIEEKRAALEALEADIEDADADVDDTRDDEAELDEKLADLREVRSTLEDVRYDLDTEQESLQKLRQERNELQEEAEALPETPEDDIDELEAEIEQLRDRKRALDSELTDVQNVIQFNEEMLEGEQSAVREALSSGEAATAEAVTDRLLDDDVVACWTCGSEVDPEQIESTVEQLRELNREKVSAVSTIEEELADCKTRRDELHQQRRRREEVDRRLDRLDDEIEERERRISELQARRDDLETDIETLESAVEGLEQDTHDELLELHREANQLEFELGRLESDREDVDEEIAEIEARIDEQDALEAERDDLQERIEDLRTKIERIETQVIDEFNGHMDAVLDLLGYENLERVWLERVERQVRQGRRQVTRSVFDLHVVRSTASGTTYEDTIDHLSESEREVTGLVFSLAGYLAHEVYERVPFMLLDSLEALDSARLATLVDYFDDYSDYLVVALLPEDAAALADDYQRITDI